MFTLKRLCLMRHPIVGDLDLQFCDDEQRKPSSIYTSVIIGKNGVGKSNILRAIVEVFSTLQLYKEGRNAYKSIKYRFVVEYDIDRYHYYVTNNEKEFGYRMPVKTIKSLCNEQLINAQQLQIPNKIIASTLTVTDKFPSASTSLYKYSGARNERSTTTSTRSIVRRTAEGLMYGFDAKHNFRAEISKLLRNLGLAQVLKITYHIKYQNAFFKEDITESVLENLFDHQEQFTSRQTKLWGRNAFEKIRKNSDKMRTIVQFIRKHSRKLANTNQTYIEYPILTDQELSEDAEAIRLLSSLDILTYPDIHVEKDTTYRLENSSSGEAQILCQFIGIMSAILQNSLVLIDEPENSCHPEWQMMYMDWLKEVFEKYSSCHFIIATHSPSILMNLKHDESTIIPLMRTENGIHINEESEVENTYSWQYEDLLQYTMMMSTLHTKQYDEYMTAFEDAIKEEDKEQAHNYYVKLINMMRPDDVLRELLQIKMLGML